MAIPLCIQFVVGASLQCCFTMLNTLLLDLHQQRPAAIQAACNLIRCALAATGTELLDILLKRIGPGWYFKITAASILLCTPLVALQRTLGLQWRQQRQDRENNDITGWPGQG